MTIPVAAQDPRLRPTEAATEAAAEIVPEVASSAPETPASIAVKPIVSIIF